MIKPFVELTSCNEAQSVIKEHGLEITSVKCVKLKNDFIIVYVDWKNPSCLAKYACDGGSGSMGQLQVWEELQFNELKFKYEDFDFDSHVTLTVGLESINENGELDGILGYDSLYFQNTKYGAAVYFAPYGWNDHDGAEILFDYNEENS